MERTKEKILLNGYEEKHVCEGNLIISGAARSSQKPLGGSR
jgi:hypothetical protein